MTASVNDCTQSVLDAQAFAARVGERTRALPQECLATLESGPLDFEILTASERGEHLLRALRGSEASSVRVSVPHRAADDERGWQERPTAFVASDGELSMPAPHCERYQVPKRPAGSIQAGRYRSA